MQRANALWALTATILAACLITSFALWYNFTVSISQTPATIEFRMFVWIHLVSMVFLLLARARAEWSNRL